MVMRVRNAETGDGKTDSLRIQDLLHFPAQHVPRFTDMRGQIVIQIGKAVDMDFRNDHRMAFTHGAMIEESYNLIVFVYFMGGN